MLIIRRISRLAIVAIIGAGPLPAQTPDHFACTFTTECVGAERPCDTGNPLDATLFRSAGGWVLTGEGDTRIPFRQISGYGDAMLSLISTQSDPQASAVTMLSVAGDGAAFVSTHGIFLDPGAVLHTGTCTAGGN